MPFCWNPKILPCLAHDRSACALNSIPDDSLLTGEVARQRHFVSILFDQAQGRMWSPIPSLRPMAEPAWFVAYSGKRPLFHNSARVNPAEPCVDKQRSYNATGVKNEDCKNSNVSDILA